MFLSSGISFSQAGKFEEVDEYVPARKVDRDISVQYLTKKKTPNHAWNAVRVDDKWHLFDVTWARDTVNKVKRLLVHDRL